MAGSTGEAVKDVTQFHKIQKGRAGGTRGSNCRAGIRHVYREWLPNPLPETVWLPSISVSGYWAMDA